MKSKQSLGRQIVGEDDGKSYVILKPCHNCKERITVWVPKGIEIGGFFDSKEGRAITCIHCGCQAFPTHEDY